MYPVFVTAAYAVARIGIDLGGGAVFAADIHEPSVARTAVGSRAEATSSQTGERGQP